MDKQTYLIIKEFKDKIEIYANIGEEPLEEKKVNASVKQIVKMIRKNNIKKKDIVINTDLDLEKEEKENNKKFTLMAALNACKIKDKNKRLEYVYMAACQYLDNEFLVKNICEFSDDICLGKRKYAKDGCGIKNGCCHEYKIKNIFNSKNIPVCRYQQNKRCIADCLGCKLFACDEVHKKGYKYTYYNVALVRYFFNFGQKIIIRCSVFTHKDKILKRLRILNF